MQATRTVKAPNLETVQVADITIAYNEDDAPREVTVVIDNELAYRVSELIEDSQDWEDWDIEFFYYLTEDEWDELNKSNAINDEWYVVEN